MNKLDLFKQAAFNNDLSQIEQILTENSELLGSIDALGSTLLHWLASDQDQASRYAHEKFWPSCPQNLFASRDLY